ncbi:MAG: tetratricopeptide repeat protein [Vampirovibrionales bacterium]|nr:tetratricopeptide repeat protein [Vampirovibrionales bacterium]
MNRTWRSRPARLCFVLVSLIALSSPLALAATSYESSLKQARQAAWMHDWTQADAAFKLAAQQAGATLSPAITAEWQFYKQARILPPWGSAEAALPIAAQMPASALPTSTAALTGPEQLFNAWLFLKSGRYPQAYHSLQALSVDPTQLPAIDAPLLPQVYAELLLSTQPPNLKRAQVLLAEALDRDPQNPNAKLLLARFLLANGQARQVISTLKALTPAPEALILLAQAYDAIGQPENVLEATQALIIQAPTHVPSLLRLAEAAQAQGDAGQAQHYWLRALQVQPELKTHWRNAALQQTRETHQAALNLWQRQLVTSTGAAQSQAALMLGLLVWQSNASAAGPLSPNTLTYQQAALQLTPETPARTLALTLVSQRLGSNAPAVPDYALLWPNPGVDDPLTEALALGLAKSPQLSYETLTAAIERFQGDWAEDYLQAALILNKLSALDAAESLILRGQSLPSQDTATKGQMQQAKLAVAQQKAQAEQKLNEGDALMAKRKSRPQAIQAYLTATRLNPFNSSTQLKLAEALEKTGDKPGAAEALKRAVWLQPGLLSSKGFAKRYKRI